MLDSYKRRLQLYGANISEALKTQSNDIMNATFKENIGYKQAIINSQNIDIRFIKNKDYSISGDAVDYLLQFRPHIKYSLGTYVSIPNDDNQYEDWIIVGKSDDILFPKYNILKCNYLLKWVVNKNIVSYKCALRSKGSSVGTTSNNIMAIVDGELSVWLPTNNDVKAIDYKTRFLISNNSINPKAYIVTDFGDELSQGVTKLIVSKNEVGNDDNIDLMIADYYKEFPKTNTTDGTYTYQLIGNDNITINTNSDYELKVFDSNNNEYTAFTTNYSITDINGNTTNLVTYTINNNVINIKAGTTKGTIILKAETNSIITNKTIKIKGLL